MAGIWERLKPDAVDRVTVHLMDACFVFKDAGTFTNAQIISALNAKLASPLTAAETTDLNNIATALAAAGATVNHVVYMNKIRATTIAAEAGSITEAQFRSVLGII